MIRVLCIPSKDLGGVCTCNSYGDDTETFVCKSGSWSNRLSLSTSSGVASLTILDRHETRTSYCDIFHYSYHFRTSQVLLYSHQITPFAEFHKGERSNGFCILYCVAVPLFSLSPTAPNGGGVGGGVGLGLGCGLVEEGSGRCAPLHLARMLSVCPLLLGS